MDTLGGLLRYRFDEIPFVILVLIIAFTLHEFAHAYAADKFGDPTPRSMGRVTLNPRVHLDLLGSILILILGFGWAKPVWIKRSNFKHPRVMSIVVAVVGPLSNLLLAFVGMLIVYAIADFIGFDAMSSGVSEAVRVFFKHFILLNMTLFIFNLLPLPPLDGYRILSEFLPLRTRLKVQQYEQWFVYVFLLFIFIPSLYRIVLGPVFDLQLPIFDFFDSIMHAIFGKAISWRIFFS